jgi:hypothetical protein
LSCCWNLLHDGNPACLSRKRTKPFLQRHMGSLSPYVTCSCVDLYTRDAPHNLIVCCGCIFGDGKARVIILAIDKTESRSHNLDTKAAFAGFGRQPMHCLRPCDYYAGAPIHLSDEQRPTQQTRRMGIPASSWLALSAAEVEPWRHASIAGPSWI